MNYQGSEGIRQWAINCCTLPIDQNYWLTGLDTMYFDQPDKKYHSITDSAYIPVYYIRTNNPSYRVAGLPEVKRTKLLKLSVHITICTLIFMGLIAPIVLTSQGGREH